MSAAPASIGSGAGLPVGPSLSAPVGLGVLPVDRGVGIADVSLIRSGRAVLPLPARIAIIAEGCRIGLSPAAPVGEVSVPRASPGVNGAVVVFVVDFRPVMLSPGLAPGLAGLPRPSGRHLA